MGRLGYEISLFSYYLGITLASPFNPKAKEWVKGRKNWRKKIKAQLKGLNSSKKTVWFHVSSLGEFEQGRPLMESLKSEHNIVLSFFSPSGYQIMKNWDGADIVCYLPIDTKRNAAEFIEFIKPSLAVFVKYDVWYHYLDQLKKNNIPRVLISARFYPKQLFFKKWASWYRKLIFLFSEILVQDEQSLSLLKSIGYNDACLTGDTRYDRVLELSKNSDEFPKIASFCGDKRVFIAGSSWPSDEQMMYDYMLKNKHDMRFIIAPHDIGFEHIRSLKSKLGDQAILFSEIDKIQNEKILIIDSIGLLSRLYKYAFISYVGGAFKEGLHNILEPAAYGIPVITGPDHEGFLEGPAMEKAGALFRIDDAIQFAEIMDQLISDSTFYANAARSAHQFIEVNSGASSKTYKVLQGYLRTLA